MKKPENFNAGATVKNRSSSSLLNDAINGNFSRPAETPAAAVQVSQPVRKEAEPVQAVTAQANSAQAASVQIPSQTLQEAPRKAPAREVKEKFLVSMSKGERSIFKSFCALQNVSMNHFVMCAMDYFKEDLENGKVTISAHSYKRNKDN